MKSNLSVDISNISSASYESLLLQVKLYEDFYGYFGFYFNIFGSLCKFMKVFLQTFDARNILQVLKLLFFEVLFTRYRDLLNVTSVRWGQVNPQFLVQFSFFNSFFSMGFLYISQEVLQLYFENLFRKLKIILENLFWKFI